MWKSKKCSKPPTRELKGSCFKEFSSTIERLVGSLFKWSCDRWSCAKSLQSQIQRDQPRLWKNSQSDYCSPTYLMTLTISIHYNHYWGWLNHHELCILGWLIPTSWLCTHWIHISMLGLVDSSWYPPLYPILHHLSSIFLSNNICLITSQ